MAAGCALYTQRLERDASRKRRKKKRKKNALGGWLHTKGSLRGFGWSLPGILCSSGLLCWRQCGDGMRWDGCPLFRFFFLSCFYPFLASFWPFFTHFSCLFLPFLSLSFLLLFLVYLFLRMIHTRIFCALYRVVVDVGRKMCVCVCTACLRVPCREGCGLAPPRIIEESNVFVSYDGVYDDRKYHYMVAATTGGALFET